MRGCFLVTLATLAYQILLTRIFSVTIWYHFAFLAISIAMLGMTVGAIAVYLLPSTFSEARVHRQLANSALAFALTTMRKRKEIVSWDGVEAPTRGSRAPGGALGLRG